MRISTVRYLATAFLSLMLFSDAAAYAQNQPVPDGRVVVVVAGAESA